MAEETISEPITGMHQEAARRLAKRRLMSTPPSFTPARWPNELGEAPLDAIGKTVRVTQDGRDQDFIVQAVGDGGELWLDHAHA